MEKWRFGLKLLLKIYIIITIFFSEKRLFFRRKSTKIAGNSDHNIDPRWKDDNLEVRLRFGSVHYTAVGSFLLKHIFGRQSLFRTSVEPWVWYKTVLKQSKNQAHQIYRHNMYISTYEHALQ
jgi:hypothetical protein